MATKHVELPDIGRVTLTKRRGNTNIRLSYSRDGQIRVSLPYWVPYHAGVEFVKSKQAWLEKHRPQPGASLQPGNRIGKAHRLFLEQRGEKVRVSVKDGRVTVLHPIGTTGDDPEVKKAVERGALKALKTEADQLLPQRLKALAEKHHFNYRSVSTKRLSSRWGSCSQTGEITLNTFLMQLPWHLIDYVIVHELVHTEHLNHSAHFWRRFEQVLPEARARRKELRQFRTILTPHI